LPRTSFNPHPSRRTGATRLRSKPGACHHPFQSSPVPKDGCNMSAAIDPAGSYCFNPHPSRRTGATRVCGHLRAGVPGFNPHPSRRTGATRATSRSNCSANDFVSILTRPEGRVQHVADVWYIMEMLGFNPHPSRRTGATSGTFCSSSGTMRFQSSPVPKDGCNLIPKKSTASPAMFQSSPVPKDGCNFVVVYQIAVK